MKDLCCGESRRKRREVVSGVRFDLVAPLETGDRLDLSAIEVVPRLPRTAAATSGVSSRRRAMKDVTSVSSLDPVVCPERVRRLRPSAATISVGRRRTSGVIERVSVVIIPRPTEPYRVSLASWDPVLKYPE
ncbi:MAG: hypothetical protein V3S30_11520 [Thermoanaerobaculia bacterium]